MITKETVDLAARHEADVAACKAKSVEITKAIKDHEEASKRALERIKALREERHKLQVAATRSGAAKLEIEAGAPQELRDNVGRAEIELRALGVRVKEARLAHKLAREEMARLAKAGANGATIKVASTTAKERELAAVQVEVEASRVQARLDAAKKAVRAAIDAVVAKTGPRAGQRAAASAR